MDWARDGKRDCLLCSAIEDIRDYQGIGLIRRCKSRTSWVEYFQDFNTQLAVTTRWRLLEDIHKYE